MWLSTRPAIPVTLIINTLLTKLSATCRDSHLPNSLKTFHEETHVFLPYWGTKTEDPNDISRHRLSSLTQRSLVLPALFHCATISTNMTTDLYSCSNWCYKEFPLCFSLASDLSFLPSIFARPFGETCDNLLLIWEWWRLAV